MQAVRFDRYGPVDVLDVRTVEAPEADAGEVRVRVRAAGINPGETMIREGALRHLFPASFPSGQGSDFAGMVESVGADVGGFRVGDEVLGYTDNRASHAELVVVPAGQLTAKPAAVSWDQGGALFVSGSTAVAATSAVGLSRGDVVAIAGAAGGVGSIAVQLAVHSGVTVLGVAGKENDDWLRSVGAIPVNRGDGIEGRLRSAAPDGRIDAFLDFFGSGYVSMAVCQLGVRPERVNTVIDFAEARRLGAGAKASADASSADTIAHLAALIASGALSVPIAATFPLSEVRAAFEMLERRRTRGKIVLVP